MTFFPKYFVRYTVWTLGMLLSVPARIVCYILGIFPGEWLFPQVFLFLWLASFTSLFERFRVWRQKREDAGTLSRNKLLEEYLGYLEYEMRWTQSLLYGVLVLWGFQIEALLESNLVGYAAVLFYAVVALYCVSGCIDEYRINNF